MKISKVIRMLEKVRNHHGEIDVLCPKMNEDMIVGAELAVAVGEYRATGIDAVLGWFTPELQKETWKKLKEDGDGPSLHRIADD